MMRLQTYKKYSFAQGVSYHSTWVNSMITSDSTADDRYKHFLTGSHNPSSSCGLPQPIMREEEMQAQWQFCCRNTDLITDL